MMRDVRLVAVSAVLTLAVVFVFGGLIGTTLIQLGGKFQAASLPVMIHEAGAYDDSLPKQATTRRR